MKTWQLILRLIRFSPWRFGLAAGSAMAVFGPPVATRLVMRALFDYLSGGAQAGFGLWEILVLFIAVNVALFLSDAGLSFGWVTGLHAGMAALRHDLLREILRRQGAGPIDLTLRRGTLCVITGRIGADGSTVLQALLDLLPVQSGWILWNGVPVDPATGALQPPRAAYVPQVPRLVSETLRDNILMGFPLDIAQLSAALHATAVNMIQNVLLFLSGALLPVDRLPPSVATFARTLPSTKGIEVLRQVVFGGRSLADTWADGSLPWLTVHSALYFTLGWLFYARCESIAKRQGSLGQY